VTVTAKTTHSSASRFARFFDGTRNRSEILRAAPVMVVAISVAVILVGLFYVWTSMQIVQTGYAISTLEEKNKELRNRQRELLLEIASLESPSELQKKAAKQGLVLPAMGKVVHVP
jgi:cell division protein FtsL